MLTRLDDKVADAIVVAMQRLHMDDLVGHLLEQGGWTHLNLPAIAETEHRIQLGPDRYHLRRPGELLHPQREPQEVLDEFKRSMGSLDFAAQYQQEPVAEGGQPDQMEVVRLLYWHSAGACKGLGPKRNSTRLM